MRALILGAGGMRIGYHVGVFTALCQRGERFNAYLGSSAGAIIAAVLAQYTDGEVGVALEHLDHILELSTRDIWRSWPLGVVSGAWKPGALDSQPLRSLIAKNVDPKKLKTSGKKLVVGAVDVLSGESRTWTEKDPDIVKGVQASCAIPGIFQPVTIDGRTYWDAAVRVVAPVRQAVVKLGADDLTVSLLLPASRKYKAVPLNVLESVSRSVDMSMSEILEGDIAMTNAFTKMAIAGVDPSKRPISVRVVRPLQELIPDSANSLELSPAFSQRCAAQGEQNAKALPMGQVLNLS